MSDICYQAICTVKTNWRGFNKRNEESVEHKNEELVGRNARGVMGEGPQNEARTASDGNGKTDENKIDRLVNKGTSAISTPGNSVLSALSEVSSLSPSSFSFMYSSGGSVRRKV